MTNHQPHLKMIPLKMSLDQSSSHFRYETNTFDHRDPFPRVFHVAPDLTEPDFSVAYSHFANVNCSKLQDIAGMASSASSASPGISGPENSKINKNNFAPLYELISNKNRVVTPEPVDGQTYPSLNCGAASMRLSKCSQKGTCTWRSQKTSWKRAMIGLKGPRPFMAFSDASSAKQRPKYLPDTRRHKYILGSRKTKYLRVNKIAHSRKKRAIWVEKVSASDNLEDSDSSYEFPHSSQSGTKVKPGSNRFDMSRGICSTNGSSDVDDSESREDFSSKSSDDDDDSSQSEVDALCQNLTISMHFKRLKKVNL